MCVGKVCMMPSALYSCLVLKMKNLILAALSQKSLSVGIVASAVFFGTTSHALASVLIAGAADPSYLNDVQAKIAGTGLISGSVDILPTFRTLNCHISCPPPET